MPNVSFGLYPYVKSEAAYYCPSVDILSMYDAALAHTPENWAAGNVGYYFWSMDGIHPHTGPFITRHPPRHLTMASDPGLWMWSDVFGQFFWSQGAPFAHQMPKWSFTNVAFMAFSSTAWRISSVSLSEAWLEILGEEPVGCELLPPGTRVGPGEAIGFLHTPTRTLDLRAPLAMEVLRPNRDVLTNARLVTASPYGRGWLAVDHDHLKTGSRQIVGTGHTNDAATQDQNAHFYILIAA